VPNDKSLSDREALEQVAAYYKDLQLTLREHQTKFDNAVLLVAGGAFTISAAFISSLGTPLVAGITLAVAWVSWALCLVVGVGGHLVGAYATTRVLKLLDAQVYDVEVLRSGAAAKLTDSLNVATFILLISGFAAFGCFTFANLDFGGSRGDEVQKGGEEKIGEEKGQDVRGENSAAPDGGEQRPVAGTGMAGAQTTGSEVRSPNDRQEEAVTTIGAATTGAATGASPLRPNSDETSKRRAEGAQRSDSATGVAPTAKEVTGTKTDEAR
jgi:hypothetical protein